jgi:FkbM family methyltransferase
LPWREAQVDSRRGHGIILFSGTGPLEAPVEGARKNQMEENAEVKNEASGGAAGLVAAAVAIVLVIVVVYQGVKLGNAEGNLELCREQNTEARKVALSAIEAAKKGQKSALSRPHQHTSFTLDFFGMKYAGNTSNELDMHVFFYGAFEKHMLFFMRDFMEKQNQGEGVFVDVGANKGHHALFMSKHSGEVHAVEPFEPVLKEFRDMVKENDIKNVKIHPVGLGDKDESLTFYEPPKENMGWGTFNKGIGAEGKKGASLPLVTGDSLFDKAGVSKMDLIKIDIEGFEKPALLGLKNTFQKLKPVAVVEITVDPNVPRLFKSIDEVKAVFPEGYEFRILSGGKEESGKIKGTYQLAPFQADFSKAGQFDLVAFAPESKSHLGLN